MADQNYADLTKQLYQVALATGETEKNTIKLAASYKLANFFLGPFYDFYLRMKGAASALTTIFGKQAKGQSLLNKITTATIGLFKVVLGVFNSLKNVLLLLVGMFFTVGAAFSYLTGGFGEAGGKTEELTALFGRMKDAVGSIADTIMGVNWTPITTMLGAAFVTIGTVLGETLILIVEWIAVVLEMWATLLAYLVEVGAFTMLIDIIGQLGEVAITIFTILGTLVITAAQLFIDNFDLIVDGVLFLGSIFVLLLDIAKPIFDMLVDLTIMFLDAIIWLGEKTYDIFGKIADKFDDLVAFLHDSGFIEFIGIMVDYLLWWYGEIALAISLVIGYFAEYSGYLTGPFIETISSVLDVFTSLFKWAFTWVGGIVKLLFNTMKNVFGMIFSLLTGDFDAAWEYFTAIFTGGWAIIKDTLSSMFEHLENFIDGIVGIFDGLGDLLTAPFEFLYDTISDILDMNVGSIVEGIPFLGDAVGWVGDMFATGGIARGPTSGYPATLHGTEAVVPLPDGRTIPVSIQGLNAGGRGGGDNISLNINVTGGGDSEKIARAVSREVQRTFRTRARSGGYGRGI